MSAFRCAAISSPCGTARAPPGEKSFWKSTMTRASGMRTHAMARAPPTAYGGRMWRIALLAAALAVAPALGGCGAAAVRPAAGAPPAAAAAAAPRAQSGAAAPRWPDRARYELDLAYDARAFTLAGTERVAFTNTSGRPLRSVWLRAWANAFGGCRARRARVAVTAGGTLGARRRD